MRTVRRRLLVSWSLVSCITLAGCSGDSGGSGSPGTVQFLATTVDATEGVIVNLLVARSGGSVGVATVDYATTDGTATAGMDYAAVSGTLTWPDGIFGNRTISVFTTDDGAMESTESFTVTLSNATGAMLGADALTTVSILDNDPVAPDLMLTFAGVIPIPVFLPWTTASWTATAEPRGSTTDEERRGSKGPPPTAVGPRPTRRGDESPARSVPGAPTPRTRDHVPTLRSPG